MHGPATGIVPIRVGLDDTLGVTEMELEMVS